MTLNLPSTVTLTHQCQTPHGVTHNHLSQAQGVVPPAQGKPSALTGTSSAAPE